MAKLITVDLKLDGSGEFSVDLIGFTGKGCADVQAAFAELGKVTKDIKKPEYKQTTCNVTGK